MKAYRVQIFDKEAIPDSMIDNMLVMSSSVKGAVIKAEKHAKSQGWTGWEIRDVVQMPETVLL